MNNSIFRKNLYLMHKWTDVSVTKKDKDVLDERTRQNAIDAYPSQVSDSFLEKSQNAANIAANLAQQRRMQKAAEYMDDGGFIDQLDDLTRKSMDIPAKTAYQQRNNKTPGLGFEIKTAIEADRYMKDQESKAGLQKTNQERRMNALNSGSSYTPPANGWGKEGSQEFKDNKKEYNQWYYQQNKDYWKNYYGTKGSQKSAMSGDPRYSAPKSYTNAMSGDSRYSAPKSYTNAMSGDPRYSVQNTSPSYSNAMAGDPRYAAPTMRVSDLVKQSRRSISAGNDFISSSTNAGFGSSSIENLWKSGAKSIINAGKSFLNAWKSGFGF